jgi:hypothetical protein
VSAPGGFAYAQARLQARYAELPGEDDWLRLAGARGLGLFLEEARTGALRGWVKGFSALSDAHDLDRGLRAIWREGVAEVARWLPAPWRAAVAWLNWLPLLPLLDHAGRYRTLPPWVACDASLRPLWGPDGALDTKALGAAGAAALLVPPADLARVWWSQWRGLWPACDKQALDKLERLTGRVLRHGQAFTQAGADTAWPLRRELRERLRLDFHRLPLQPAAAFAFLGLLALDLERLRAALMQRALFPLQEAA